MSNKTALSMLFIFIATTIQAQSIENLRNELKAVIINKSATVGVAIHGMREADTLSINGEKHLPMQSVFKFHLALAILNEVDNGTLALNTPIEIRKELIENYQHLWSPLREKYPNGATLELQEILKYTVAWSDNMGCDVLFDLLGGPAVLQHYLQQLGIDDIAVIHTEMTMQSQFENQFENWTTARASTQLLKRFYENENLLSTESYLFLLETLKETTTGKSSIKGLLPATTAVAHKTGSSGQTEAGLTAALNDIGIVFLPDNTYFYLSVFVSNSSEDPETNQQIIAEIAKCTYDYFTGS
ncbi:class A beta-lactamase, subclass A2 [Leeuwenhoekiella sp. MAR_2009_132]|uniref:class A beta-lactamase, subclass A2 n=1 Tax=Leeuwenhoekiella sp. MAR_2009_132 TaxID=1392489 RepID=UPI00048C3814|nr:class A beta-lactamase, subclass A2 [Leeuwenhoekiella sp. MAR_2009_132]